MVVSVWASFMASWFSPSSLFVVLNLTIGTIFLMTRFGTQRNSEYQHLGHPHDLPQLARAPSLLDRVRSINFSIYKFEPPSAEAGLHNPPELVRTPSLLERLKSKLYTSEQLDPNEHETFHDRGTEYPAQLVRNPSWLERLKSIKLYGSDQHEAETFRPELSPEFHDRATEYPTQLVRTPSLLERLKSIKLYRSEQLDPKPEHETIRPDPGPEFHDHGTEYPAQLVRTPSWLERLKSIKLYRSEQPEPETFCADPTAEFHDHGVKRSKSESGSEVTRIAEKMTKSASERSVAVGGDEEDYGCGEDEIAAMERRRPATTRVDQTESPWEDDGVDAKADDFINRFKQQLKLQRLESLKRFSEMWKGK